MEIVVKRKYPRPTYTIGKLYINGRFICDTCEDRDRGLTADDPMDVIKAKKVYAETAIPKGRYKVILNFSPKFKRELPRLLDVPGFSGVLIHRGNSAEDSAGCILVGENKVKGKVINSTNWENQLVTMVRDALSLGESCYITIE